LSKSSSKSLSQAANQAVLADTGPLYALADPSDQYHARSRTELTAIEARNFTVAVSYATLCETHTLILRRLGGAYASQWLDEMLDGALLLNPEAADYSQAAAQLTRFPDHAITLVDAVTGALSRRFDIPVWTFDRHFATMRHKLWH
jgi:predicted nucleic acid-binding protein